MDKKWWNFLRRKFSIHETVFLIEICILKKMEIVLMHPKYMASLD